MTPAEDGAKKKIKGRTKSQKSRTRRAVVDKDEGKADAPVLVLVAIRVDKVARSHVGEVLGERLDALVLDHVAVLLDNEAILVDLH